LCWSFGGVLGKSTGASGVALSFWRMWIASAVLLAVAAVGGRWPNRADVRRIAPLGAVFGLNICTFWVAVEHVTIAVALVIGALTPVVALPIAVVFVGERLTFTKLVCAAAAVTGVIVAVLTAPSSGDSSSAMVGYVWAVASLLLWVLYLLMSKQVREQVDTVHFMLVVAVVSAVTVSAVALVTGTELQQIHGAGWWWVTMLAVGPGIVGHGLLAWAQPRVDASVTSVLVQAETVGASIAAWAVLGERISLPQGLAMLAVVVSLSVLAYRESREGVIAVDTVLG